MKKLPELYKNTLIERQDNNRLVYCSSNSNEARCYDKELSYDEIIKKVDEIFNSTSHSFFIPVEITTRNKKYFTKLLSRTKSTLVTVDGEKIFIDDIIDFKVKSSR